MVGYYCMAQAITADTTEQVRQHLVAAGAVMRVELNNFRNLLTSDLPGTAQAQHMFRVLPAALVTDACLAGKERLKTFTLVSVQREPY